MKYLDKNRGNWRSGGSIAAAQNRRERGLRRCADRGPGTGAPAVASTKSLVVHPRLLLRVEIGRPAWVSRESRILMRECLHANAPRGSELLTTQRATQSGNGDNAKRHAPESFVSCGKLDTIVVSLLQSNLSPWRATAAGCSFRCKVRRCLDVRYSTIYAWLGKLPGKSSVREGLLIGAPGKKPAAVAHHPGSSWREAWTGSPGGDSRDSTSRW